MKRSEWVNPKRFKARIYVGNYRTVQGERQLELTGLTSQGKVHRMVFESHEAAKLQGWRKK